MDEKIKWSEWLLMVAIVAGSFLFAIGTAVAVSEIVQLIRG